MPNHPLAEVFGFPIDNFSPDATRHRDERLCPYNNIVPECTKDKKDDPLGVCSIFDSGEIAITCPVRFREDWRIAHDAAFFIDPPYTAAGKRAGRRLYNHFELDHEELFCLASKVTGEFLMTYDHAEDLIGMAKRFGFETELIRMQNTHLTKMTELLISRSLKWASYL